MYFSQKCSSRNIYQTKTDIEDPSNDNVQDMEENNISKYHFDPMVKSGVIVVEVSVIHMSSLERLSKLFKPPKNLSFISY